MGLRHVRSKSYGTPFFQENRIERHAELECSLGIAGARRLSEQKTSRHDVTGIEEVLEKSRDLFGLHGVSCWWLLRLVPRRRHPLVCPLDPFKLNNLAVHEPVARRSQIDRGNHDANEIFGRVDEGIAGIPGQHLPAGRTQRRSYG